MIKSTRRCIVNDNLLEVTITNQHSGTLIGAQSLERY